MVNKRKATHISKDQYFVGRPSWFKEMMNAPAKSRKDKEEGIVEILREEEEIEMFNRRLARRKTGGRESDKLTSSSENPP